jgi:hypothetical protein
MCDFSQQNSVRPAPVDLDVDIDVDPYVHAQVEKYKSSMTKSRCHVLCKMFEPWYREWGDELPCYPAKGADSGICECVV